jgi:hypothetical protein
MKFRSLLALFAGLTLTMTVGGQLVTRLIAGPPPQTSPAVITPPPPRTVVITPIETTAAPTTTPPLPPETAHDAMQADLGTLIAPDTPCQEWAALALDVGWPPEQLGNLLDEMWSESRCQPGVVNQRNMADHGLMQLNEVWRDEFEAQFGPWEQVTDPRLNLAMALEIWRWHQEHRGCGWEPWNRPC